MSMEPVVTRFAPSPTGFMHIGGVRTALFAWAWARKNTGVFILRIEDTDKEREVEGSIEHIQESLRWLGIEWDFGPGKPGPFGSCIQSERLETYREAARMLIDKGFAYPDPYTPEELEGFRAAAQADKRPFLFRDHRPEHPGSWDGTRPLRLKVPEIKRYYWHDAVRGDLEAGEEALDDLILIKSDGYPTYNFAHIVDDHAMGVTHVMRGDEFISSTPKFLSIYDALGWQRPVYATLPPILRADKTKKLGKRDGAKDLLEYRAEGYLPEAMVNFLALIGWNPGGEQEVFSREEFIEAFDLSGIQTHGGVFNEEKLKWFNRTYIHRMDDDQLLNYIRVAVPPQVPEDRLRRALPEIRERTELSSELAQAWPREFGWLGNQPSLDADKLVWKDSTREITRELLEQTRAILSGMPELFEASALKDALWDFATEKGRGAVLWPMRYALTGADKSPDPFVVAAILGKQEALGRLDAAITLLAEI